MVQSAERQTWNQVLLTQGERDVLSRVARGLTNQEIAEALSYSSSSVKLFLHQACAKLGARNRAQAVLLALRKGAISPQDAFSLDEVADLLSSLSPHYLTAVVSLLREEPGPS